MNGTEIINEIVSSAILLPIVWWFIKNTTKNFDKIATSFEAHTKEDTTYLSKIFSAIDEHNRMSLEHFKTLQETNWLKDITIDQAILLCKKSMLSGSYKKLDYIKKRLVKNALTTNRNTIERQLKTELLKLSDEEYLYFLDWFKINGTKLGDLIRKTFTFEEFFKEVVEVVFNSKLEIHEKLDHILEVMKFYQNECIEEIRKNITHNNS